MAIGDQSTGRLTTVELTDATAFPHPIEVLGCPVTPFQSIEDACDCVERSISAEQKCLCVAINPEKVYRAHADSSLRAFLENCDMRICDGVGAVLAARILHGRRLPRITGADLCLALIARAPANDWKVFLLGGSRESNDGAYLSLTRQHPNLEIVGHRDGYFSDTQEVIDEVNASGADLLFCGMGSPKQELWLLEYRDRIRSAFCMGVGGTFDVVAGRAKRAPKVFRRYGCEWLFRLIAEPRRWRRQTVLLLYAFAVARAWIVGWDRRRRTARRPKKPR